MFSQAENLTTSSSKSTERAARVRGNATARSDGNRLRAASTQDRWGQPTSANTFSRPVVRGRNQNRARASAVRAVGTGDSDRAWPMLNSVIGSDEAHLRCRAQRVRRSGACQVIDRAGRQNRAGISVGSSWSAHGRRDSVLQIAERLQVHLVHVLVVRSFLGCFQNHRMFGKRGSCNRSRNGSSPRHPWPIWACRSTWPPSGLRLSSVQMPRSLLKPMTRSNSAIVAS